MISSAPKTSKKKSFLENFEEWLVERPCLFRVCKRIKVQFQKMLYYLFKFFGWEHKLIYDVKFYRQNLKTNVPIAKSFAQILIDFFHPHSVVDVGCGAAEYLNELQKMDIQVKGFEGNDQAIQHALIDKSLIEKADLRKELPSTQRFDLALCLEVAEHIETEASEFLVSNLTKLSDQIVFTAAHPGQGGHFHINEKPKEFWVQLWREFGFEQDTVLTEALKKTLREKNILSWYVDNVMVFKALNRQ